MPSNVKMIIEIIISPFYRCIKWRDFYHVIYSTYIFVCCVPGTVPDSETTLMSKIITIPCRDHEAYCLAGVLDVSEINMPPSWPAT